MNFNHQIRYCLYRPDSEPFSCLISYSSLLHFLSFLASLSSNHILQLPSPSSHELTTISCCVFSTGFPFIFLSKSFLFYLSPSTGMCFGSSCHRWRRRKGTSCPWRRSWLRERTVRSGGRLCRPTAEGPCEQERPN